MNKTIFFLILAVCILGMALILLNQRLGRDPESRPAARAGQSVVEEAPVSEPAPAFREGNAGPDAGADSTAGAPAMPSTAPASAPALENKGQRSAAALPDAEDRRPARDREAAGAAADALALERQEAEQALHGTPPAPATPTAAPKASSATTAGNAPQQTTGEAPRQPAPARTAAPAKKPAEKAAGRHTITRFVIFARETGATVRLTGNGPLRYKSMNLDNPDRVVLDLEGDWEVKAPAVPKNPLVSAVRVGDMGGRTRVVIDLKAKPRSARVIPAKNGDGVDVRVDQ